MAPPVPFLVVALLMLLFLVALGLMIARKSLPAKREKVKRSIEVEEEDISEYAIISILKA